MKRRSYAHDYSRHGYYHITISTTQGLYQPLGQMAGRLDKPDSDSEAPHVELSAVGRMVEIELLESIHRFYPMLEVQEYVIMPEHIHFLLVAHSDVVSRQGKPTHLGHVIAGFKYGCNKRYWAITGERSLTTESPGTLTDNQEPGTLTDNQEPGTLTGNQEPGTLTGNQEPGTRAGTLVPLFDAGYCDVMPIDEKQLATQRAYILANPRSRLLRTSNRNWLQPQRNTVDTALTLPALKKYLAAEIPAARKDTVLGDSVAKTEQRLLLQNGHIACDSYGSKELLSRRLLPVVCHRRDAALFAQQKACCLTEAASGAVLISARISKGEQEIMDSAILAGLPVILIEDNGFPEIYHPSANRMDICASGQLLLLAPWKYLFRANDESISVVECKTMNCVAQAISRTKDCWWKSQLN